MIAIDDNIPLPEVKVDPDAVYPFRAMTKYQSFFVPHRKSVDVDGWNFKLAPRRFVQHTWIHTDPSGEVISGVRVWRVE